MHTYEVYGSNFRLRRTFSPNLAFSLFFPIATGSRENVCPEYRFGFVQDRFPLREVQSAKLSIIVYLYGPILNQPQNAARSNYVDPTV